MNNLSTGKKGEKLAAEYLHKNGYTIMETNFSCNIGEIDIIVEKDGIVIFCEVKTRKNTKYGYPYEAVNLYKQRKIVKTALNYIKYKGYKDTQYRFDIMEVYLNQINGINHIQNAFWA